MCQHPKSGWFILPQHDGPKMVIRNILSEGTRFRTIISLEPITATQGLKKWGSGGKTKHICCVTPPNRDIYFNQNINMKIDDHKLRHCVPLHCHQQSSEMATWKHWHHSLCTAQRHNVCSNPFWLKVSSQTGEGIFVFLFNVNWIVHTFYGHCYNLH